VHAARYAGAPAARRVLFHGLKAERAPVGPGTDRLSLGLQKARKSPTGAWRTVPLATPGRHTRNRQLVLPLTRARIDHCYIHAGKALCAATSFTPRARTHCWCCVLSPRPGVYISSLHVVVTDCQRVAVSHCPRQLAHSIYGGLSGAACPFPVVDDAEKHFQSTSTSPRQRPDEAATSSKEVQAAPRPTAGEEHLGAPSLQYAHRPIGAQPSAPAPAAMPPKNKAAGGKASGGGGAAAAASPLPPSMAGRNLDSTSLRASIPADSVPHVLPPGPDTGGEHCWSQLPAEGFQIRGAHYLSDKVKVAAGPALFDLMHVTIFRSNDKIGNFAARQDSWLRAARRVGDTRYYLVITYVTPAAPYVHICFYYAVQPERVAATPHFARLWMQFTAHGPEGDAFRNDRWKVIPRIAEGSWMVQRAVGTKPALLAQKLTHTWIICDGLPDGDAGVAGGAGGAAAGVAETDAGCAPAARTRGTSFTTESGPGPYLEADCDSASSSMAFVLVSMLQTYAR
jgi:hypothetical protein